MTGARAGPRAPAEILEDAFRRLPLVDGAEAKMAAGELTSFQAAAATLAGIHGAALPDDRPFRDVAARRSRADIAALRRAAKTLAANPDNEHARDNLLTRVAALRQPAIVSLADAGFLRRAAFDQAPEKIVARATAALDELKDRGPPFRGRCRSARQADAVAAQLAVWFRQWTGRNTVSLTNAPGGSPTGYFFELLRDVLGILQIDASPEAAISRLRRNSDAKTPLSKAEKM
jgi:hypothetical protein